MARLLVTLGTGAADDPRRAAPRRALALGFVPVVRNVARRYRGRGEPVEDLEQAGTVGLLRALDRFVLGAADDPVGAFLGYAVPTIDGEIKRYFRDLTWVIHAPRRVKDLQAPVRRATEGLTAELGHRPRPREIACRLGVSVDLVREAQSARSAYSPESIDEANPPDALPFREVVGSEDGSLTRAEGHVDLRAAIATLSDRDRRILGLRFFEDHTQAQIAAELGISQMHVSRLLRRCLGALREQIADATSADAA